MAYLILGGQRVDVEADFLLELSGAIPEAWTVVSRGCSQASVSQSWLHNQSQPLGLTHSCRGFKHLTHTMPPTSSSKGTRPGHDMSVILVTGSYDHEIRFWEAWSGICSRTIARTGESGVSIVLVTSHLAKEHGLTSHFNITASKPPRHIP